MKTASHPKTRAAFSLLALMIFPALSLAQQGARLPRIGFLYPAGAQNGAACEITVGGQYLEGAKGVYLSGTDVKATVLKYTRPLPQKRFNELRDYIDEARKKLQEAKADQPALKKFGTPEAIANLLKEAGATEDEIKIFFDMRKQRNDPKRQQNVQLEESVTLKLEIAPGAPVGPREIRILTPLGLTNPLNFCVGGLPELIGDGQAGGKVDTAARVTLPVVLDGRILPGTVDHYSFEARRGAHIVVAAQGRDLMPYLADAVPGWFQPVVAIYDAKGREMAYADHFRFNPDPVLCFDVPRDGVYLLEIRDALYRGREDFVYRITMGEVPFVTSLFPLGGKPGVPARIALTGWNLRDGNLTLAPLSSEGIHPVRELNNGLAIGERLFAIDDLPQCPVSRPNNDPSQPQPVQMPVIINGRINSPGEVGLFTIQCRKGDKVVAETYARRLHSQLDSWLKVTDAAGHQIAFNDDTEDKSAGLLPHGADSYLTFTAPADGAYSVQIGDSQSKGGPEYGYRLRISKPLHDFALRIVPSSINARPGVTVPVTIYALRKDGYSGGIDFALKDAPAGFVLDGGRIPPGENNVRATLTFPQAPLDNITTLTVEGRATVDGREVRRVAVPADDMMQAFAYHHLVPAGKLLAVVTGTNRGRAPIKILTPQPVKIVVGGTGETKLSLNGKPPFSVVETKLQITDPPDDITVQGITATADGATISFKAGDKVKPGLCGNLILEAFTERTQQPKDGKPPEKKRWSSGILPAIPFEIVAK